MYELEMRKGRRELERNIHNVFRTSLRNAFIFAKSRTVSLPGAVLCSLQETKEQHFFTSDCRPPPCRKLHFDDTPLLHFSENLFFFSSLSPFFSKSILLRTTLHPSLSLSSPFVCLLFSPLSLSLDIGQRLRLPSPR